MNATTKPARANNWNNPVAMTPAALAMLGTVHDREIAALLRCTTSCICKIRQRRGIPAFQGSSAKITPPEPCVVTWAREYDFAFGVVEYAKSRRVTVREATRQIVRATKSGRLVDLGDGQWVIA